MQITANSEYFSISERELVGVQLAEFIVLSGPNGSGKSNLLNGIKSGAISIGRRDIIQPNDVRLMNLGDLSYAAEGPVQASQFKEPWADVFNHLTNVRSQADMMGHPDAGSKRAWIRANLINSGLISEAVTSSFEQRMHKPVSSATYTDFTKHGPLTVQTVDPFAASISSLFVNYNIAMRTQLFNKWLYETGQYEGDDPGTAEDFTKRFGPKPWELLDETLRIVGLNYAFVPPPSTMEAAHYEVKLRRPDGIEIGVNGLSSGERVLLAISMGLFTGSQMTGNINLPRLLLLDEPDASLHPEMSRSLLTVVEQVFVQLHDVPVILTTHSPSTVALAPEQSLFVMNTKSGRRIQKVSRDVALKSLTVGLSTLSVRVENRRQVFVESEYDQEVFQVLYGALKELLDSEISLEFIPSGNSSHGGGRAAVLRLVAALQRAGTSTVKGLVDRDLKQGTPENIAYVGDRYSVENLCFDPLLLGIFLLRERLVYSSSMGLPDATKYYEVDSEQAQAIVEYVTQGLRMDASAKVEVEYAGGFTLRVPRDALEMNGHDFEKRVLEGFEKLKRYDSKRLKFEIVNRVAVDLPRFVPLEVVRALQELAT